MNRASVEPAFSITPGIDGSFVWSSDFRTVSFVPTRELQSGTTYAVVIDSSARDLAGNTMAGAKTFQFSTAPRPLAGVWWGLVLVGAPAPAARFMILPRPLEGSSQPASPPLT